MTAPDRQREATEVALRTVDRRARAEPVDASVCEREAINAPGAVQVHAVLLACDPGHPGLAVQACSDNVVVAFDRPAQAVLGQELDALVPSDLSAALRAALAAGALADPAQPLRGKARLGSKQILFEVAAHLYDDRLIVEFEPAAEGNNESGAAAPMQAHDGVRRLRGTTTLAEAAESCARAIRDMTGFERVLVYRFDPEWNGEAVAEDKIANWTQSLAGLRFPASDIPAQARALYTKSSSRFVCDRDAPPSTIRALPEPAGRALDLTFAQARALSPTHLEYQRNLGVNGSMSISILVDGALWGLVIGHHRRPYYLPPEVRALASLVTDAFALRVHELETVRVWREQQATLAAQNKLLEQLAGSDDFVAALTEGRGATLLDLFDAGGAAVLAGDLAFAIGQTPPSPTLVELAAWLRKSLPRERSVFATACISEHFSAAGGFQDIASGLLLAFVDAERRHALIWFRPEVVSIVLWGGDPGKPVLADALSTGVLPRRSFERWVEERRGHAEPWADWQLGTAEALAAAIEDVALRQGRRIAELTAKQGELTRALEQKDVLAREIDHRVKNSLQIVASVLLMQARGVADAEAKAAFESTYARVMSVARVHESLHQSADVEHVDLGQTLRQLCSDLSAGLAGEAQRLEVSAEPGLLVPSRAAVALSLIVTELVTNALKYAYDPGELGEVKVSVAATPNGGIELRVCDQGKGLPANWSENPDDTDSQAGLGTRLIRAMLQQIGAHITVETRQPGACFRIAADAIPTNTPH